MNFDFEAHCLVASDGARLHASNGDTLSASSLGPKSVIVPMPAVQQMVTCRIGDIRSDGNVVAGVGNGLTLRTYAIDGKFPPYESLLCPRENTGAGTRCQHCAQVAAPCGVAQPPVKTDARRYRDPVESRGSDAAASPA